MTGQLDHSPEDIVRRSLINNALGTLPSASGSWPIGVAVESENPDSCITVYGTEGIDQGRDMVASSRTEKYGIQIRVRSAKYTDCFGRARDIAEVLDSTIYRESVTIDSSTYLIQAITRTGPPLFIGKDSPTSKRTVFVVNAVASITKT